VSQPDDHTIVDHGVGEPDHLQRLWTPHRMSYIAESPLRRDSSEPSRPFTDIPQLSDEDGLVVARGELVYVVLNLYPYNPGHLMVVPYRVVSELEDACGPDGKHCPAAKQSRYDDLKFYHYGAEVTLGVGIAAVGTAGALLFFQRKKKEPAADTAVHLKVVPSLPVTASMPLGATLYGAF